MIMSNSSVSLKRYKYKAFTASGRPQTGVLSANDEIHLHQQLDAAGMTLVKASEIKEGGSVDSLLASITPNRLDIRDLLQFYIQMEQMQKSGIPLLDALSHCRNTLTNKGLKDAVSELHRMVSEGMSLSEAFAQFPKYFSKLEVSILGAAEKTGDMVGSYNYLIDYLKARDLMERRIKKATRYPTMLVVVILVAIVVLMKFVVPQIVGFLEGAGNMELGFATTSLMATSEFFQNYWWVVIGGIIGIFVTYKGGRQLSGGFKTLTDRLVMQLPSFGDLVRKIEIARFSYIVSSLYQAGVPFLDCLSTASESIENTVIHDALQQVQEDMRSGSSMSDAINNTGEFPAIVVQMVKIGEESGNMAQVLDQVAEFYNTDVEDAIEAMISAIEPSLTAIMGLFIAWVAIAVFGPIYSMIGSLTL